jgi:hypothetical protein
MKTSRGFVALSLVLCSFALDGCGGSGEYVIPNVAPVVKQKADDSLLEDIEGGEKAAPASSAAPATETKAEPKSEPKAEPKSEPKAPVAPKK